MNLLIYLNRIVYINLLNGYYYRGLVTSADEGSITLRDKNGKLVSLKVESIERITEVGQ